MTIYENALYREDVRRVAQMDLPWNELSGRSVLLSGATGLLGSFLVDTLMEKNRDGLGCTVYALGRSRERMAQRFSGWMDDKHLQFIPCDVNRPLVADGIERVHFAAHLASHTHPVQYATDPIGTITANMTGLQNMLELASACQVNRFAFASSNEIYGENRGDTELFTENYCGYIDSNTLRAGYGESKRCGEALCQAYRSQRDMDVVIPRFTRSYGPTMLMSDTKAISQFIKKGVAGEDIVLKSAGTQYYSYTYMADAIYGLLMILFYGKDGEAYNVADTASNITLRDLARLIADHAGRQVVWERPDAVEETGYSRVTKALLDGGKLQKLGWKPFYDIGQGITRTMDILRHLQEKKEKELC